ncbi:MAG: alpha-1,2-mannosyltransferase [Myxococcota bacterium]|jgi:alpha-1,2-mannosyltransferase
MSDRNRALTSLLLAVAVVWHVLSVVAPPKIGGPTKDTEGRDFASYYYAVQAAADGSDPYEVSSLNALAKRDGTRTSVHPFFYPPPYLLAMTWVLPMDLGTGFTLWYWLNELFLLVAALSLVRWWSALGEEFRVALAGCIALMFGVVYSLQMGQVNFIVLALVVVGLWQDQKERPVIGGALLGLACMLKMSPALFVAWWLLRRRWVAAAAACGAALGYTLLALPLVGAQAQWRFYTEVLPKFGSGDYNGLAIQIDMFGNHSLPNVLNQLVPGIDNTLSPTGQALSTAASIALVVGLGWVLRAAPRDGWALAGQVAAVSCATLLIPVYTYEHHLIWALPAMSLAATAVWTGRLSKIWGAPVGLAVAALCYPLPNLKQLAITTFSDWSFAAWVTQELKFVALLTVFAAATRLGARR